MATILCGKCHEHHTSVAAVRACHTDNLFTCHWMVERLIGDSDECWLAIVDCGAEAIATERGWTCAAGHEHVTTETRLHEGWDYAEDAGEAMNMVRAGIEPFTMDGHLATSPADFAPTHTMAGRF